MAILRLHQPHQTATSSLKVNLSFLQPKTTITTSSITQSSQITTAMSSSSSPKDYSSALGSLMSTYGTSGSTPTPIHHSTPKSKSHRSSSRKQRDELSSTSPTPSQSSTSLLHKDTRHSSEEMENTLGHLQSQYGLGSFGAGMSVPTMRFNSSSESKRAQKSRSDKDSVHSTSSSKVGSLLSRYGFGSSGRDSR